MIPAAKKLLFWKTTPKMPSWSGGKLYALLPDIHKANSLDPWAVATTTGRRVVKEVLLETR